MLKNLSFVKFENDYVKESVIKEIEKNGDFHFFTYLNGDLAYVWIIKEDDEFYVRVEDEDENLLSCPDQILIKESYLKQF